MTSLELACILFGLTLIGGVGMFGLRLRGGNPPLALAIVHGLAAGAGLLVLTLAVVDGARGSALLALVLFVVTALGGFLLLSFHLKQQLLPVSLILVHAALAIAAFVALLIAALA